MKTLLMILVIGFAIWLIFSWVYDLTPEGIKKTKNTDTEVEKSPKINQRLNRAIIGFLSIAVILLVVNQVRSRSPKGPETANNEGALELAMAMEKSIAILPFTNVSGDEEQDYFCYGIAEDILIDLARIGDIRVASRTSSFSFKGENQDIREIGLKLGVQTILEGSVRKAGDKVRITAQLVSVKDGFSLWSEHYDRDLTDVFAIQNEISKSIVQALELKLILREKADLDKVKTQNVLAYDYYNQARYYHHQSHRRSTAHAIELFSKAIEIDTGYTLAYCGLANSYSDRYTYYERSKENLDGALAASQKALELDPELAEAHASRGWALVQLNQYQEAAEHFELAIQLDPQLFEAYYEYGRTSRMQGKLEKTVELFRKATEIRPEDYEAALFLVSAYDDVQMEEEEKKANAHALKVTRAHLELYPDDSRALYLGAGSLIRAGEQEEALQWLEKAVSIDPNETAVLYNAVCIYSLLGMEDKALDYFERTIASGYASREWIENDTDLDPIREHPRFQKELKKLN
jgi:TolB-like protein/Flp pilus assembly protein TadD